MIRLFGSLTSPYVRHCRIALLEEDLPFEMILADSARSAKDSPTKRVPYFHTGQEELHDSSAILTWVRAKGHKVFLPTAAEANRYFTATTAMETGINLFLLERDGITDAPYLDRQRSRLRASFAALDNEMKDWNGVIDDGVIRLGCLLTWVAYRERFDFSELPNLVGVDRELTKIEHFAATMPPST